MTITRRGGMGAFLAAIALVAVFSIAGAAEAGGRFRIVSLAPSITEILFALGLGDDVVGVTRYCDYPPEAASRRIVGGYYDPSYEAILSLRPDMVVVLAGHEDHESKLSALGLKTLSVDHRTVKGILSSIAAAGEALGAREEARSLLGGIKGRMDRIAAAASGLEKPSVLVSVGRNMGTGSIKDAYIAGPGTYYDDMIALAGGRNAYQGVPLAYPAVSAEGILRMRPDYIIDMVPDIEKRGWDEGAVVAEWEKTLGAAGALPSRVIVFGEKSAVIPGPRFIDTLERIARAIHPEADLK